MQVTVRKGTTGKVICVYIRRSADPQGKGQPGLRHDTPGASACFLHDGTPQPMAIPLAPVTTDGHCPGGLREIDAAAMPGLYEFHLPDEILRGNGNTSIAMLRFPGADPVVLQIDLVGYDPYDSERLGLACLSQSSRHAVLEKAFREVVPLVIEEYLQQLAHRVPPEVE